eukprot:3351773-Rhodomonas_salina.1
MQRTVPYAGSVAGRECTLELRTVLRVAPYARAVPGWQRSVPEVAEEATFIHQASTGDGLVSQGRANRKLGWEA